MSIVDDLLSAFINFDDCHGDTPLEPAYEPAKVEEPVLHSHHNLTLMYDLWPQFFDILNPCLLSPECSGAIWDSLHPESPVIRSSQSLLFSVDPTTIYPRPEEPMSDLISDSGSTDSSPHSSPFSTASSDFEECGDSSTFLDSPSTLRLEEEGKNLMTTNLLSESISTLPSEEAGKNSMATILLSESISTTSTTQDSPLSSITSSPSSPSSPSSSILQAKSTIQEDSEQGSHMNPTKAKLQKNRIKTRSMLTSSPKSCKSQRATEHSIPESSSSDSVKSGNAKRQDDRYACDACGKMFTRRADIPRHMQSSCLVIGKAHLPTCDLCGKAYSRLDAIRRHQRIGDCIGGMGNTGRSG